MTWVQQFRHVLLTQRRRLATLFLLVGIVVLGRGFVTDWPREREVRYLFEGPLRQCKQARIGYSSEGEVISAVELRFPDGAPSQVVHHPTLAEGRYDVTIDVTLADGKVARHQRVLTVPFEGVMRFRLPADPSSHD